MLFVRVLTHTQLVNIVARHMRLPLTANFIDKGSGSKVPGVVQRAVEQDLLLWLRWRYRTRDPDRTWDRWGIYLDTLVSNGRHECYAALAAEELQGLMQIELEERGTRSDDAVIVDYLSTNPINRTAVRGLKYVGLALIATAIIRSVERESAGRIWLESLSAAARFYENLGMEKQPFRSSDGHLVYTLESEAAEQLLEEIKKKGIIEP
jgi:hypothetical protein